MARATQKGGRRAPHSSTAQSQGRDALGYALVKELLSRGPFISGEGTVYPILRRLQSDGLLVSRWAETPMGPPRKYYLLSQSGCQFLVQADAEWEAIVRSMSQIESEGQQ